MNHVFLTIQCYPIDFLLRISFTIERATIAIQSFHFRKKYAKYLAKWIILISILVTIATHIHDLLYRQLLLLQLKHGNRLLCKNKNRNLLIVSCVLIMRCIPRLITSFTTSCMKIRQ